MNKYLQPMQPYPGLEKYVQTIDLPRNRLRLFYYAAGDPDKPAALLLHGLGDEADTWRYLIEPLSHHWRVIAPDLPGFGRSDKPRRAYRLDFLRGCIFELLNALSIPQIFLIGHSLGGMLAHSMALEQPERVNGLVLVDGALLTSTKRLNPQLLIFLIPGVGEWLYTRLRKDPQAAFETLWAYYDDIEKLPQAERDFLFFRVNQRVWCNDQRRAYFSVLRNMASTVSRLQKGLPTRLALLHTPTLILWGEHDQINPPDNGIALHQVQPETRLKILPQAGHLPHHEQAQAVVDEIFASQNVDS